MHRSVSSFSAKKDNTEGNDTMAKPRMDLSAFVGKLLEEQDGDVLREGIRGLSQALMESEVAGLIGAERHERTDDRRRTATAPGRARGTPGWGQRARLLGRRRGGLARDPSAALLGASLGERPRLEMAEERWRKVNGSELLPLVRASVRFVDGVQEKRKTAAEEVKETAA